jgi:HAD superfamily hydrolase (TIGR01509 family)
VPAACIRGLILDFDGMILDTETPEFTAWSEVYRDHGCHLASDVWAKGIGTHGGFDPYAHLAAASGRPVPRATVGAWVRERVAALLTGAPAQPGVVAYLDEARRLELRVGLASSSSREWVETHLATLRLRDRFDCIRCRGDAPRVKPAPDLYLAALDGLALSPAESVALEDSPNGVAAAKAAGLFCAAVPHGPTTALDFSHADVVLPSLAEVPLVELLTLAK